LSIFYFLKPHYHGVGAKLIEGARKATRKKRKKDPLDELSKEEWAIIREPQIRFEEDLEVAQLMLMGFL